MVDSEPERDKSSQPVELPSSIQNENEVAVPNEGKVPATQSDCANSENEEISTKEETRRVEMKTVTFPDYPSNGIIGNSEPEWLDIFYSSKKIPQEKKVDYRRQKFDFHKAYENVNTCTNKKGDSATMPSPLPGLWNLWSKFNRQNSSRETEPLPTRFQNPEFLKGDRYEPSDHPLFRTTSSEYGKLPPQAHDISHEYHGLKTTFTAHLTRTGMPKNRSLNIK